MDPSPEPLDLEERPGPVRPPSWRSRLEQVADATGTSPARIALGAVLLVVAVGAGWWATRPPADPVEVSLPFASTTLAPDQPAAAVDAPVQEVAVVHVAGAVVRPGVYELAADARVLDAVAAAGGLADGADERQLNLAAPVLDGTRVHVPLEGEELLPSVAGDAGGGVGAPAGPLDLNRADAAALEALPGVGPATATAIVEHRDRIGRFTSVDQLLDVRGIGEAKLAALRDLVRV